MNCKFFVSYVEDFENSKTDAVIIRSGWGFAFVMLPYGDAWRASRRIFTKYFNSSDPSTNQSRDIKYVRRFLGLLLEKPNDFLHHVRTYVPIYHMSNKHSSPSY